MDEAKDLVERARRYAVARHRRIGHRRKYTEQPYETHLANVVRAVAASSAPELIMRLGYWLTEGSESPPAEHRA